MGKYVRTIKKLENSFKSFSIKKIPWGINRRVDTLSKLASTCFAHLTKKVLVEVLKERSIDKQHVDTLSSEQCN